MRRRFFAKLRESFPGITLAVEVGSVVFAVLLALFVNEWRENRKTAALASLSLASIEQEIESNLEKLRRAHAFQSETLDMMRQAIPQPGIDIPEAETEALDLALYERGVWRPARPLDTAWKTAETTGILSHMELERVLMLAGVYSLQASYQAAARSLSEAQSLVLFLGQDKAQVHRGLLENLNTLWWREKQLIELYEEALAAMTVRGS